MGPAPAARVRHGRHRACVRPGHRRHPAESRQRLLHLSAAAALRLRVDDLVAGLLRESPSDQPAGRGSCRAHDGERGFRGALADARPASRRGDGPGRDRLPAGCRRRHVDPAPAACAAPARHDSGGREPGERRLGPGALPHGRRGGAGRRVFDWNGCWQFPARRGGWRGSRPDRGLDLPPHAPARG